MTNTTRSLPRPLTARSLWHWVYFYGADSALSSCIETAKLGIKSNASSAMSGDWKKTKVANADFGGFSSNVAQIWCDQQKMHLRSEINRLPVFCRALGNLLYKPEGEASHADVMQIQNHLYRICMKNLQQQHPSTPPERRAAMMDLIYCALCHYRESISPAIEGQTPKTMDLTSSQVNEVGRLMASRDRNIDTRNWSRQWKYIWQIIMSEISKIDDQSLRPLDKWIGDYIQKIIEQRLAGVL